MMHALIISKCEKKRYRTLVTEEVEEEEEVEKEEEEEETEEAEVEEAGAALFRVAFQQTRTRQSFQGNKGKLA